MPASKDALRDRLSRSSEINITVTGRKSGRTISNPIWFVFDKDRDKDKLYLLPVKGSETQWYKNVLKNPSIQIDARGADVAVQAVPITDAKQVSSVVEMFRAKYGTGDVKKYYSKLDVAVLVQMP
jgi:deazaflavin-dependent oxidoreductase (nitroreductase family)